MVMLKKLQIAGLFSLFTVTLIGQVEKPVSEVQPRFYDAKCEMIAAPEECRACAEMQMVKKLYTSLTYPAQARENSISGEVIAQFTVKADGTVADVSITQSLGYGCDEATMEAIQSLGKFVPGQTGGQPADAVMTLPVRFRVERGASIHEGTGKRNE